ncbi:lysozyme inhibitor LprI family protein [Enterovibrio sp. 27052020O]|uniref:lysozyme inhibitor LprI family protein n=1 Tax=Enterovibrio sp. 27052020O TaxID=3241166 RepID=UPI003890BF95
MMRKELPAFILMCLPFSAVADKSESALLACYKAHETHVEVTACLDNYWQAAQAELDKTEAALNTHFVKLDQISSVSNAVAAENKAVASFEVWREEQCKMVEASYASGTGSGQGYLSCMIELTNEQVARLNGLMGVKGNAE